MRRLLSLGLLLGATWGCAGFETGGGAAPPASPAFPAWVERGSGAFDGPNGRGLYGVGACTGVKNRAVAWTSDVQGHWARDWVNWPEFPRFAAQLIGWVLPNVSGSHKGRR